MRNHNAKRWSRKYPDELPSTANFLYDGLTPDIQKSLGYQGFSSNGDDDQKYKKYNSRTKHLSWRGMRPTKTYIVLILSWIIILWWGERTVFSKSISACSWRTWEQWSHEASPHHVVLIADPQLVDPHTYPGRPWPISALTVYYTDLYLRRSFSKLRSVLDPDTVFFLGDLFDGGREWATGKSQSPDKQWKNYGGQFWLQEYDRFGRIFLDEWNRRSVWKGKLARYRKFIASLPGNHDLGLGNGIRLSVSDRFNTYFGYGNRVDIVGNHTFVSIDTVSLSAKDQPTLDTTTEDSGPANIAIWGATDEFLSQVKDRKSRALDRELRAMVGKEEIVEQEHKVLDINDPALRSTKRVSNTSSDLPTILLTHIPLYRATGTPCGPLRERWPPSKAKGSEDFLERDDQNAILVSAGYQYQNVLQPSISNDLIERVGNVEYVFSGDDHDYCEVLHRGYTSRGGGVREITVKSASWAMGVRRPGFLMLSLWNPIDETGHAFNIESTEQGTTTDGVPTSTLQSRLCLLPDQLGIFIRYGFMLGLMVTILIIRALYRTYSHPGLREDTEHYKWDVNSSLHDVENPVSGVSSLTFSNEQPLNGLASRPVANRTRSTSPVDDYGIPITKKVDAIGETVNSVPKRATQRWGQMVNDGEPPLGIRKQFSALVREITHGSLVVASFTLPWYIWLVWTG